MLTIARGKRQIRRFTVFDLEWVPGSMRLRVCGTFDGNRYRAHQSIESFLKANLTEANRGRWFYAHFGGMADMTFVLHEILTKRGYKVNASFSSSSAIIVKVQRGQATWWFVDSFWLLRDKLANIGKSVGMAKGGPPGEDADTDEMSDEDFQKHLDARRAWYASVPLSELIDYNAQDCRILWEAINRFEDVLLDWGGQLQKTIASCALHLFRRRFLKQDIETSDRVNERARLSYHASRVESFNRDVNDDANYFDVNSSFPYAMTFPCPGRAIATLHGRFPRGANRIYMAECTVNVPEDYLPPLPYRAEGKVFFPTGRWRQWFTSVDLELLEREGGQIEDVGECIVFEPFEDLREYATTIYEHRKSATDPFIKLVDKYLLNALYGKFAESPLKEEMLVDPDPCSECGRCDCECDTISIRNLFPGVWLKEKEVDVPHMHVPISTHITSIARRTLYDFMSPCSRVDYCDTDGFSTPDQVATSKELGGLKWEKRKVNGMFPAPKFYQIECEELQSDGSWKDATITKGKGFSRMNRGRWMKLYQGEEIEIERMKRMRELYREGVTAPQEKKVRKKLKLLEQIPKRMTYPDGTTRPWSVKELESL